ncbi:MAG TPA: hypothetical protein VKD43_08990, partial [Xanthobacteraceae bacterium]|nr:hypothetical protein [Xanthobacteraceae bacterium]
MRRIVLALALALIGCAAHAAEAAKDPLALIQTIYKAYAKDTPTPSLTDDFYSRRMQRLLEADRKATPQGDAGTI